MYIECVCVCVSVFQDTAGQERYHALGPIYYRDSQGAIIVYDITDEDSFHKVLFWKLRRFLYSAFCFLCCCLLTLQLYRVLDERVFDALCCVV